MTRDRAESIAANALALELAKVIGSTNGITLAVLKDAIVSINEGRFTDGKRMLSDFHSRPIPPITSYRPGDIEFWSCVSQYFQGALTESEWQRGYEIAKQHRNVGSQYDFLALRSEWLLTQDQAGPALEAIDEALKIVNRLGTPRPDYHDLRAWCWPA